MAAQLRALALGLMALLLLAAPSWAQDGSDPPTYETIAQAIDDLGLTSLQDAISIANLTTIVEDPATQVILLAPSDEAFSALLTAANLTELPSDLAQTVLLYHVIPINAPNAFLNVTGSTTLGTALQNVDGFGPSSTEAVGNVTLIPLSSDALYVGGVPPGATINTTTSFTAGQSRIYLLDSVLLPPAKSLQDPPLALNVLSAIEGLPNVTFLTTLLRSFPTLVSAFVDPDLEVTLFAPNDEAILALAGGNLSVLAGLAGTDAAARLLRNHVVPARPLTSGQVPEGVIIVDTASTDAEDDLTITKEEDGVITVAGTGNETPATVVSANIVGGKSVIHVIDTVLVYEGFGSEAPNATSPPPSGNGTSSAPPPLDPPTPVDAVPPELSGSEDSGGEESLIPIEPPSTYPPLYPPVPSTYPSPYPPTPPSSYPPTPPRPAPVQAPPSPPSALASPSPSPALPPPPPPAPTSGAEEPASSHRVASILTTLLGLLMVFMFLFF